MKMHEADVDISTLQRDRGVADEVEDVSFAEFLETPCHTVALEIADDPARRDSRKLEDFIKSLRGKIGTEELILILILLVVASDGIGIEALVLGLLLMVK